MSVSRSVAEILSEPVTLEIEGIDRMYLNVYVPALRSGLEAWPAFSGFIAATSSPPAP
jgi:hypothetical protein